MPQRNKKQPTKLMGYYRERALKKARKQCATKPVTVQCSDCKETGKVPRNALLNRTRMRCQRCGGPMNRTNEA